MGARLQRLHFSRPERNLLVRAVGEAEWHTSRYYRIPPFKWQEMKYDLLTCQDEQWEPLPETVFARLQLLEDTRRNASGDFYRIQLNDPSILSAAAREKLTELYPFLLFILTHEMVHLVRVSTILGPRAPVCPDDEEKRVQRISWQILSGQDSKMKPVLEKFCFSDDSPLNPTTMGSANEINQ
jgi:hypothetical protein